MSESTQSILRSIDRSAATVQSLQQQAETIDRICAAVVACLSNGKKVLTAGSGGSAAMALHLAEELVGRFDADRPPLPALALVADPTLLTCITNDFGYAQVFARQVLAHGREGDVLVLFSTSGNGDALRLAVDQAAQSGVQTVALLGKDGGALKGRADLELIVASDETARIQEAHQLLLHVMLEAVERAAI